MNPELVQKLKKLLALANGGNGNEAELALEKAQTIAAENDIDLAVVGLADDKPAAKPEMVKDEIQHGKRLPIFARYAHWILGAHFNVSIILSGGRYGGRRVVILGDKPDVEFAIYVKSFLEEDMQRRWDYYYKSSNGKVALRLKHTWAYEVWRGLDQKLTESKQAAVKNKIASMPESLRVTVENKYTIVVAAKENELENFKAKLYPKLAHRSQRINLDYTRGDVKADGFATGRSMNISRPIAGQKALT